MPLEHGLGRPQYCEVVGRETRRERAHVVEPTELGKRRVVADRHCEMRSAATIDAKKQCERIGGRDRRPRMRAEPTWLCRVAVHDHERTLLEKGDELGCAIRQRRIQPFGIAPPMPRAVERRAGEEIGVLRKKHVRL